MRAAWVGLVFLAVAAPPAATARHVSQQANPAPSTAAPAGTLHSVEVAGSSRYSSAQIAQAAGLKPGAPVSREDLQAAANLLAALGTFSSVRYEYRTTEAGLDVRFQVADAAEIPVSFDNFPWFSDQRLIAAIQASVPLFDGAAPGGGSILDAITGALERFLVMHDVQENVTHSPLHDPLTDQPVMQLRAEGVSLTIAGVEFSDALAAADPGVKAAASAQLIGKSYSRDALELFESQQVRPIYLRHAHLQVRFDPAVAKLTDPAKPMSSGVAVTLPIEPGPAFTWSGVSWIGASAISPADLDALVPLKPGDLADGVKIGTLWDDVRTAYGHLGYLDLALTPAPHFDTVSRRVSYSVEINEGPQYHMGQLVLSGLSLVGEKRIRDAWKIPQGAVFDQSCYEQFLDTGIQQAFAGTPIHYEKIGRYLQKDPSSGRVDVMLDFE